MRLCIITSGMSSTREPRERLRQKLRTRAGLLDAARRLAEQGKPPTVAEAADAAMVSRATAYRYFPTREALLVELPLEVAAPTVESLFSDGAPPDPEDRVALVQNALYDLARDHEIEFRLFLRSSLMRTPSASDAGSDPFRGARRLDLLEAALAPLAGELPAEDVDRLRTALSMLVGVESMVVLRDVLRLDHDEACAAGEWAVRELVRAARARATSAGSSRPSR
jgi:AcrR family transcriptional regulator